MTGAIGSPDARRGIDEVEQRLLRDIPVETTISVPAQPSSRRIHGPFPRPPAADAREFATPQWAPMLTMIAGLSGTSASAPIG